MPQIEQIAATLSSQVFWLLVFFGMIELSLALYDKAILTNASLAAMDIADARGGLRLVVDGTRGVAGLVERLPARCPCRHLRLENTAYCHHAVKPPSSTRLAPVSVAVLAVIRG